MEATIGIIGYGFVGKAVAAGFPDCQIHVHDPAHHDSQEISKLVRACRIIFIAVPTPSDSDGGPVHTDIVVRVLEEIDEFNPNDPQFAPIICIKSTVPVEELRDWRSRFPRLRLTMSPEYLREADAAESFIHAKLLVVGAEHAVDAEDVVQFFKDHSICDPCPTFIVDLEAAGIIKYMENTFLAMKVIFMNEWKAIHEASGSETPWDELVKVFHGDPRLGCSHGAVPGPDGKPGFGGKCLPKDLAGAIWTALLYQTEHKLLRTVDDLNRSVYRRDHDWTRIPGAVK